MALGGAPGRRGIASEKRSAPYEKESGPASLRQMNSSATSLCETLVEPIWKHIVADVGAIIDHRLELLSLSRERHHARPAGVGEIHISFRLGIRTPEELLHGCLLLPLGDAIALAGFLMMVDDDIVERSRDSTELDLTTKEALLEIGTFLAAAVDSAVPGGFAVIPEGCQGARPGVRPRLDYREGQELIVGRARLAIHHYAPCEALLVLPDF